MKLDYTYSNYFSNSGYIENQFISFMSGKDKWSLEDFLNISEKEYNEIMDVIKLDCKHEWKEYKGFTEQYFFCSKCDKKQKENPSDVHNINKPWWA